VGTLVHCERFAGQLALNTARQLEPLRRDCGPALLMGGAIPFGRIPFFVVGYTGWKNLDTVRAHLADGFVDGILVIDPGLFVGGSKSCPILGEGAWSLWGLINSLHTATIAVKFGHPHPRAYG